MLFDEGQDFLHKGIFNEDAMSLDSKESGESGEVLTGTLVDIDDDNTEISRRHSVPLPIPIIIRPKSDDDDDTDSASIISSSSGSSGNKLWDIIHSDEGRNEEPIPPVPPPRKKHKPKQQENSAVGQLIDLHSDPPTAHKQQSLTTKEGSDSPLNDFTSGIAESLVNLSKRYSDPLVANTVSSTGQDLFDCVDSDTNKMTFIPEDQPSNDPWKPLDSSPNLSAPSQTQRAPPPPKPQPYIGTGPKLFMEVYAKQPGAILTPNVTSENESSEPKSQDPLADIFGNGGLHAYAFQKDDSKDISTS